jgi:hypothetical protein
MVVPLDIVPLLVRRIPTRIVPLETAVTVSVVPVIEPVNTASNLPEVNSTASTLLNLAKRPSFRIR